MPSTSDNSFSAVAESTTEFGYQSAQISSAEGNEKFPIRSRFAFTLSAGFEPKPTKYSENAIRIITGPPEAV